MNQSLSFKIILFLAFLQGVLACYALIIGSNSVSTFLVLLLPFVGTVAVMRGLFISVIALLYVLSVIGALRAKAWAWWTCFIAVVLNLLIVVTGLAQGAPALEAIAWSVIPVILLVYLFSASKSSAPTTA